MQNALRPLFAAALVAFVAPAFALEAFINPREAAPEVVHLAAPSAEKSAVPTVTASGLLRVGDVRALEKAQSIPTWTPAAGGYVSRFRVTSDTAVGLRVRLDLGAVPGAMSMHVQGDGSPKVETMEIDPTLGPESWTPWTEGGSQLIEVFSRVKPSADAVRVGAVLHMVTSPLAKAAASCTISTACSSDDPTLDALIDERKKSVAKIQFVRGGSGFLCSATLIDTPRRPQPYILTANHCIDDQPSATSMTTIWFYESAACGIDNPSGNEVQVSGGAQLVFTSYNVDSTVMLMNRPAPAGTVLSPVNAAIMPQGTSIVSISHPHGDTARWGTGKVGPLLRDNDRPYDMYSVNFNRGIIEPGSSGSGVFTVANGRLELRGVLSQGANDLSCSQPTLFTLYGRLEAFYPQIAPYIGASNLVVDDAPNRPQDVTATVAPSPLDTLPAPVVLNDRRIDFPGDVDVYKFTLAAPAAVTAFTTGTVDTIGIFQDGGTHAIEAVDDAETSSTNTGITKVMGPGTFYFSVGNWNPAGTGSYNLTLRADRVDTNHTALWWNAAESGWGININHQGNIVFATLFTYNPNGTPLWLVMSKGDRQPDGSYSGILYKTTGPVFNASPWSPVTPTPVGTMSITFSGEDAATLVYTYNGVTVTKQITRQQFGQFPTCSWSAFDRSFSDNFQDLWWNPNESGWGVNIAHQEDILFATLFTYNASGQPMWYVMSAGEQVAAGRYSGALYRVTGPAFNTVPWTPVTPVQVGNMSFNFTNGNAGTMTYTVDGVSVTKQIQRQVFATLKTQCEQ
jgi:hypothetical protein